MYKLILPNSVQKFLDKIDRNYRNQIYGALLDLEQDPYIGKKLSGKYKEYYSLRTGVYRIIYKIIKEELYILVLKIRHRKEVYK